ncbi:MAG: right-handed parallel beta-helix repeat-containing protein [Prevotella sp.]|nr:right-handed parallel beta-helix repeat-containing protein [Prevotella sp.]
MKKLNVIYAFIVSLALLTACNDDDTFTLNTTNRLMFSVDTVRLDTVFSRIPTSTKTFWVYNQSGDGIRCTNVRLEKGNQMGFRVNVDGIYLGETSGYQVNDIEVRNKDSIRVFVELTSAMANQLQPKEIEDNLIFQLESGVQQKVNINAWIWDAEVWKDKVISNDTTIQPNQPIIVYGKVKIEEDATLSLAAGTTLYFHDGAGMDVYGRLISQGTVDNNVVLRGDRLDRMFDNLPYDRVSGQWDGIRFYETSYNNFIDYTDLHSAKDGIVCDSSSVDQLKLTLQNSIVHNCKGYGVRSISSQINIINCQITNSLMDCVSIVGGKVLINHCTIAQFYPFNAERGAALWCSNYLGDIKYPLDDLTCYNSMITGYADDVVYLISQKDDETPMNYRFDHCLLRTPQPKEANDKMTEIIWEDNTKEAFEGKKNFRLLNTDDLLYDFRLDSISKAIDSGNANYTTIMDRLGIARDEKPDLGCYEYVKQ